MDVIIETFDDGIRKGNIDLTGCTSVFVMSKPESDQTIREFAEVLIHNGCRDFGFCGVESDRWHRIFDDVDIKRTDDEDDYAMTWEIESIESIPDDLYACKERVYVFCTDHDTVLRCRKLLDETEVTYMPAPAADVTKKA